MTISPGPISEASFCVRSIHVFGSRLTPSPKKDSRMRDALIRKASTESVGSACGRPASDKKGVMMGQVISQLSVKSAYHAMNEEPGPKWKEESISCKE